MRYHVASFVILGCLLCLATCGDRRADSPAAATALPAARNAAVPQTSPAAKNVSGLTGLKSEIGSDGLKVVIAGGDFDSGTTRLAPHGAAHINRVIGLLKERSTLRVVITSYTDDRGSDAANQRLSQQRADSVRDFLIVQGGVDPSRLQSKGLGEADPVASNDTAEGRAQNRRVELRIVDSGTCATC